MLRLARFTSFVALAAFLLVGPASHVLAATPTPTPTSPASTTAPAPPKRPVPPPKGGPGLRGGDPIAAVQHALAEANADLGSAQGKMDLSQPQSWLKTAADQLSAAESAQSSGKAAEARTDAGEAHELAAAAQALMEAKLGSALPSVANRPTPPSPPPPPGGAPSVSPQARVSRDLAHTYHDLLNQRDALGASKLGSPWTNLLQQAEATYAEAYQAYQAASYDQAAADAHVVGHLSHAIGLAANATIDPTQPVTVPAPQF